MSIINNSILFPRKFVFVHPEHNATLKPRIPFQSKHLLAASGNQSVVYVCTQVTSRWM